MSATVVFAGPQEIFEKGNAAYAEGNYTSAKDAYELLVLDDNISAELFYNLGNTYFKLGENANKNTHLPWFDLVDCFWKYVF